MEVAVGAFVEAAAAAAADEDNLMGICRPVLAPYGLVVELLVGPLVRCFLLLVLVVPDCAAVLAVGGTAADDSGNRVTILPETVPALTISNVRAVKAFGWDGNRTTPV